MFRKLLTLAGLLLMVGTAQAQWGVRAGLNATTLRAKNVPRGSQLETEGGLGYQVGVFYEKPLGSHLSLVPEAQLSFQQADLRRAYYPGADAGYQEQVRLRRLYVQVPVLLRARLGRVYLEAGPQAGVLQAAYRKGTVEYITIAGLRRVEVDEAATDQYRRFDAGLCAGLGVQLPAGFGLGLRGYQGFVPVLRPEAGSDQRRMGQLTNQSVEAAITYQWKRKS